MLVLVLKITLMLGIALALVLEIELVLALEIEHMLALEIVIVSTTIRELEIIEKFLHLHYLLVQKVLDIGLALVLEIELAPYIVIELVIALVLGS